MRTVYGKTFTSMTYHSIDEEYVNSPILDVLENRIAEMCKRTYLFDPCKMVVDMEGKELTYPPNPLTDKYYELETFIGSYGGDEYQTIFTITYCGIPIGLGSIEE